MLSSLEAPLLLLRTLHPNQLPDRLRYLHAGLSRWMHLFQWASLAGSGATLAVSTFRIVTAAQFGAPTAALACTVSLATLWLVKSHPKEGEDERDPLQDRLSLFYTARIAASVALAILNPGAYVIADAALTATALYYNERIHQLPEDPPLYHTSITTFWTQLRQRITIIISPSPEAKLSFQCLYETVHSIFCSYQTLLTLLHFIPEFTPYAHWAKTTFIVIDMTNLGLSSYCLAKAVQKRWDIGTKKLALTAALTGSLLIGGSLLAAFYLDPFWRGAGDIAAVAATVSETTSASWGAPPSIRFSQGINLARLLVAGALLGFTDTNLLYPSMTVVALAVNLFVTARLPWFYAEESFQVPHSLNYGRFDVGCYALLHPQGGSIEESLKVALQALHTFVHAIPQGQWQLWKPHFFRRWYEIALPSSFYPPENTLFLSTLFATCRSPFSTMTIYLKWAFT